MSIDPIERINLVLCLVALGASFALMTPAFAASLGLGAVLEAANLRGLRHSANQLFSVGEAPSRFGVAGFGIRFGLMGLCIGVAIYAGAHPVGLLIGLSLVVPAAFVAAWRMRPPVVEDAPALPADDESWDTWNPWLARESEPDDENWS